MTAHTDGTLMDDAELIEMLQRVATEGTPPLHHGIEHVLAKGRRARRRRQVLMVPASSLAVAGVAALVFAMAHAGTDQPQLFLSPAASGTQGSPRSTVQAVTHQQVLQEAFGDDFAITPEGDVTVRPGSPSADGLPTGLAVATQLLTGVPNNELAQFCAPMVEKGMVFSACTQRVLPGGQLVYEKRGRSMPGGIKPGRSVPLAYDMVRVLFVQPNGELVIVDLSAQESESSSTPERRASAQAWLDGMTSRLANAATDPRVRDAGRQVEHAPKGSRTASRPAG